MITTEPNPYWHIVTARAEQVWEAHCEPGAGPGAGHAVYLRHARDFDLLQAGHIAQVCLMAVVHEDAPAATRAQDGTVNIDRLVPPGSNPDTRNAAADYLVALQGFSLSQALAAADQHMTASSSGRIVVQTLLNGAPHGRTGRARALDALWGLRDDAAGLSGVLAVTGAALEAVRGIS